MDKKQAQSIIKETFENPFDKAKFTFFIKNLLNTIQEDTFTYRGNYIPDAYEQYINTLERIGKYSTGEHKIDILIAKLKKETSIERARTMQRNFIAWYLNGSRGGELKDAALVAYVSPNEEDWRFSLVKMDYWFEEGKKGKIRVKEEFTPARRWSFLVGVNENSHTAQSQLVNILADDEENPTLNKLEEAFNIETVTKEFFEKYRELFLWTKETLDNVIKKDKKLQNDFESKGVNTVDFSKKLMGQIVFLYFLQKKGWFGVKRDAEWGTGPKNFLRELFAIKHGRYNNFFNDILEPLFYEALARERDSDFYSRFNCKIPFLNGGLFDPINNYDWVHTDILLPNDLFSNNYRTKEGDTGNGILDIFDRYNFTVKEDEPLDKEVAIDPEMLGKVFENLLEIKDRKSKGTYYTPREIVHYMCQQSLINYLYIEFNKGYSLYEKAGEEQFDLLGNKTRKGQMDLTIEHKSNTNIPKEDVETLIKHGEQVSENELMALIKEQKVNAGEQKTTTIKPVLPESIRQNAELIDKKLVDIRVCDPAIGSGAFPVGMMSEIVKTRKVLSAYIKSKGRTIYNFKRECIEKSLYGVDVDSGACEIAKLRLWLSLVVDEDDIKQIKPLPNLDYKIVCGNSLLGYPYTPQGLERIEILKNQFLNEVRPKEKNKLREEIDKAIYNLYQNTEKTLGYKVTVDFKINFSEVFKEKDGFDVVIANPPYVGQKGNNFLFKPVKQSLLGRFHQRRMDYFYFFFHLALEIGKKHSITSFITTNYYSTATYADKLRADFKQRSIVRELINFNELKIFKSALGQHNMLTILEKGVNEEAIAKVLITQRQGIANSQILRQILSGNDPETLCLNIKQKDLYDGEEYYIRLTGLIQIKGDSLHKILDKIKMESVLLGNICSVIQGIVTGADKISPKHIEKYKVNASIGDGIFVLSNQEVNRLSWDLRAKKVLKPWFKNSDIFRWGTNNKHDEQLIYYTSKNDYDSDLAIKKHFEKYKIILINRNTRSGTGLVTIRDYDDFVLDKKYISYVMIASTFKRDKYYCISYARDQYIFEGPKIVVPQRSSRNTFGYNEVPWYASADVYFITEKDSSISLKYILFLLNSKLYYLWLYHRGKRKGETLELYQKPLSEIPIKKISKDEQMPFVEFVDKILSITNSTDYLTNSSKRAKVEEYESQIDQMVYNLYGLTKEEIRIVEKFNKD